LKRKLLFIKLQKQYCETLTKLNEKEWYSAQQDHSQLLKSIKSMVNDQFDQMEHKITNIVDQKIKEKQEIDQARLQTSFADTLAKNLNENTIENAIRESLNKELIQETERSKREKNIIIHGIAECDETEKENEDHDELFITSLLRIIGANVKPLTIDRLGKPNAGKRRPVKLVMSTTEHKDQVMSRLVNLKNAEDKYKIISVKDDYTFEERDIIKQWIHKANEKNKKENTTDWKVRGSPKNGLRLVKVTKRKQEDQQLTREITTNVINTNTNKQQ